MTSSIEPTLQKLIDSTKHSYNLLFSSEEEKNHIVVASPGRVNIIGEHVDYNGGFVLPMAINYYTVCCGTASLRKKKSKDDKGLARVCAMNINPSKVFEVAIFPNMKPLTDPSTKWMNYILGVFVEISNKYLESKQEEQCVDFSIVIEGNIPLGSGLSSSAAIEVTMAKFFEVTILPDDLNVSKKDRALLCQKAENNFCSSPCGIMDQYICTAGTKDHVLFIDCTSYSYEQVSFITDDVVIVICNSQVKHSIADGEYPIRVKQCQTALSLIKEIHEKHFASLRFVSLELLEKAKDKMIEKKDNTTYNRAYHVITEDLRTSQAKKALQQSDFKTLGKLMVESHNSLRDLYEVSCKELDLLVDLAMTFTNEEGIVYGSRMTGGGFGGCTVSLVKKSHVKEFTSYLKARYKEKTGKDCDIFVSTAVNGVERYE